MDYGDYVDQLTNLLFLKIRDEQTRPPYNEEHIIPERYNWNTLLTKRGSELQEQYEKILKGLSKEQGLLGLIYRDTTNKIRKPANLEKIIHGIDTESWYSLNLDVKGEIYEGLLEKHSAEVKDVAGQYFTPRALISTMVEVLNPKPGETICDPACGTGGFFLEARKHITKQYSPLNRNQQNQLKSSTFYGTDNTPGVVRLCAMNMYLHNLATTGKQIREADSLQQPTDKQYDIILTNPPFGSYRVPYARDDFWASTGDKELNFLQHAYTSLKIGGRCGIVIPDGVLFGTTNAHKIIRDKMMHLCNVHTILRLPKGIFYAGGVSANVVFFEKKRYRPDGKPWTDTMWFYDLRTNMKFTQKTKKMERHHLGDFVQQYMAKERKESERFKEYTIEAIEQHGSWDMTWLQDDSLAFDIPDMTTIMSEISDNIFSLNENIRELKREVGTV